MCGSGVRYESIIQYNKHELCLQNLFHSYLKGLVKIIAENVFSREYHTCFIISQCALGKFIAYSIHVYRCFTDFLVDEITYFFELHCWLSSIHLLESFSF